MKNPDLPAEASPPRYKDAFDIPFLFFLTAAP